MKLLKIIFGMACLLGLSTVFGTTVAYAIGTDPTATVAVVTGLNLGISACALPQGSLFEIASLPHLLVDEPADNIGGVTTTLYWALVKEFELGGIKTPHNYDTADSLADLATIREAHAFKSGKGFKRLYVTEDTGYVTCTPQGELKGKSYMNKIGGFHPSNRAAILGAARYLNNSGVIMIGKDGQGLYRQVGSEDYPGNMTASDVDTGVGPTGRRGYKVETSASANYPAPIYPFSLENEASDSI